MQCPPNPGPGVNFMKPKGLVAAASTTSHTSRPSLSHISSTSLASPMFTARKVFSSSFAISAAPVDDTGTIGWTAAPGCNADSVADYMTATLLSLHTFQGLELEGKTIGIIGVGQVGSRVAKRAEALGLRVLPNDPPRAAREGGQSFQTLETLLRESDIITLHVPLIKEKPWPTLKMADCRFFEQMKRGAVFINVARGQVLDSDALLHAKANGIVSHAVLDVWDPEPLIRADVPNIVTIGTPHIAGYSLEGKLNGTVQVYREACHFFETAPVWNPAPLLPAVAVPELKIDSSGKSDLEVLAEAVAAVYDIGADQLSIEDILRFDKLRSNYGVRREFKNTVVSLSEKRPDLLRRIAKAGFTLPATCAPDNG